MTRYRTWFFDCDGVLLDSNALKTDAFRSEAARFGSRAAGELVRYHCAHGGIGREVKAKYFFERILGRATDSSEVEQFVRGFAERVRVGLASVPADEALVPLLEELGRERCRLHVVTGGDEREVRGELERRGLAVHFLGIHGGPTGKLEILDRLERAGRIVHPAVFVGDSAFDLACAKRFGLDFIYVEHWSEWAGWQEQIPSDSFVVENLAELRSLLRNEP
jgi:phosphoglycolate phosphatase-like HAD superfamily hydrolase